MDQDEKDILELLMQIANISRKPLKHLEDVEENEIQLEKEEELLQDEVNFLMNL